MADLHEVVEFDSVADDGGVERATVDGGVGSDLDVIADFEAADLRELVVSAGGGVGDEAEAVAAEDRAGFYDHAVTEGGTGVDHDAGDEVAVLADGDAGADDASGTDAGVRADPCSGTDDGQGFDGDGGVQLGGGIDDGRGVDAWCFGLRESYSGGEFFGVLVAAQFLSGAGEGQAGIAGAQEDFTGEVGGWRGVIRGVIAAFKPIRGTSTGTMTAPGRGVEGGLQEARGCSTKTRLWRVAAAKLATPLTSTSPPSQTAPIRSASSLVFIRRLYHSCDSLSRGY